MYYKILLLWIYNADFVLSICLFYSLVERAQCCCNCIIVDNINQFYVRWSFFRQRLKGSGMSYMLVLNVLVIYLNMKTCTCINSWNCCFGHKKVSCLFSLYFFNYVLVYAKYWLLRFLSFFYFYIWPFHYLLLSKIFKFLIFYPNVCRVMMNLEYKIIVKVWKPYI